MAHRFHQTFFAVGGNLGDPKIQCLRAIEAIRLLPKSHLSRCSSFYKTEPLIAPGMNPKKVHWYINAVCQIETLLLPQELIVELQKIEKALGRQQRKKWESRVIDLDLLFYDNQIIRTQNLKVPHPEIQNRRFVLEPLKEIAPDWIHPVFRESIAQLAEKIKGTSQIERIR